MITVCNTKSPDLLHFCMSWICYICSRCCRCGRCSRCDRCGRCWQCISFGHFHHGNLAMPQTNVMSHIDLTFRISNCILFYSNNKPFSKINKKHTIELNNKNLSITLLFWFFNLIHINSNSLLLCLVCKDKILYVLHT